jgi:phage gpG-like protein
MEVIGLSETLAAIQEELNEKARQAKNAVKLAGQAYANDVKSIAPYDTGTLRRSIHVELTDENGQAYAIIGTDLPYARRLEYGFYDMTDRLGRHYHQVPRPYFRPPLDTEIDRYFSIMKGELENGTGAGITYTGKDWVTSQVGSVRPDLVAGVFSG